MEKRVKTAVKTAVGLRNYQRARARALTKLGNLHPDTYRQLLEEEKRRDEVEGKKWHSLDDGTIYRMGGTPQDQRSTTSAGGEEGSDQGNDGAKA